MKTITSIIVFILNIILEMGGSKEQKADRRRLKEDKKLADAIRRGDGKTVGRIRERRKKYKNLIVILFVALSVGVTGCVSTRDVPLTQGTTPYQLAAGEYYDTQGQLHIETNNRWSVSEEDLLHDTQNIGKTTYFRKEDSPIYILGGFIGLLLLIKTFKNDK